jgi:ribosomal protein S12 methylthiotransferase accessory factor
MGRNRLNELGIEDLFSPYTGLVTYIAETERLLCDPNVFVLASELCNAEYFFSNNNVASNGSGAGLTYKDTYYSTLGECAERYSLSVIDPDRIVFGTYNNLKDSYKITEPGLWNLFNDEQLKTIPFPKFTKDTPIAWILADHLLIKEEFLVPACAVYLPYVPRFLDQGEQVLFPSVSTGAACYTSYNESILRGIYELIERDTFIICWRNKLPIPEISIDEDSPLFNTFIKKFLHIRLVSSCCNSCYH